MPEMIGQTLNRYQIIDRLVEDYWGSVYKAYDPKFDRFVAVQILKPHLVEKDKLNEHFLQVGRTILSWRHSGIARVFDVGQHDALTYLVREFTPGANLQQLLEEMRVQGEWINLAEAVQLARQVCLALDYAHKRDILHGDLHPGNILFVPESAAGLPYQPVLTNLGLYKPGMSPPETTAQAYRSPEVARGERFETRADIYSVGVLLYELTTGQLPVDVDPKLITLDEESSLPFMSPGLLRKDLPELLEKVLHKTLAQSTVDRYPDADSLAKALAEALPQVAQVKTAPSGLEHATSLLPVYQRTLGEEPYHPPFEPRSAEKEAIDISEDQVHILDPDQTTRSVYMKPEGLSIGRASNNDIVVDQPGTSRHHARVDFDGEDYLVRDLKSMNGTYLEEERLSTDAPRVWLPGENLRIGKTWLRLERAEQSLSTIGMVPEATRPQMLETEAMFLSSDGHTIDPSKMKLSSGQGWIGVFVETPSLSVSPGDSVSASLLIFNRGPAADTFQITLSGIPSNWIFDLPQSISLPAGSQREVNFTIKPTRSPESRAGRHVVIAHFASQNAPGEIGTEQSVEARLTLTISAYSQFHSELRSSRIHTREVGQVLVHNQGNLPETFTLLWEDKGQNLTFDPPQVKIVIPAGKSAAAEFRPSPIRPDWFGGEAAQAFTAHVSSQAGQLQSHRGEFISRGLIPAWAPIALVSLCAILFCVAFLFLNQLTMPARYARQTTEAGQTAIALVSQETAAARTATAGAFTGANQSTIQAATATAEWLAADDDQDGLNNSLEIQAGTRPDQPDTDEDGLNDGDEVNVWKTNPVISDSDGDGIKDGDEVERGIDPLKKDTDGDGIEDAADPDPAKSPTQTPQTSPTSTSSPTNQTTTPTITLTPQGTSTDLSISMNNGQASSIPGTKVTYTIVATNKGPIAVTNAKVVDMFPGSIINATWTCSASVGSKCQTPNGIANINALVDLAVNGTATLTAVGDLSPDAIGLLINTANITAPAGISEMNTVDNMAIDTDTLTPKVSLSVTKTDNLTSVAPGQSTTYTIAVTNNGPSAVSGVNIMDTFPTELSGVTWTCSATPGSSCSTSSPQPGNINTSVSLAPGGIATITAYATVTSGASGSLSNTVFLSSPIDPANNNKNAVDTTAITSEADLMAEVIAPLTATVSTPITYTINVTNTGPSTANNVVLTDLLPVGTTFISSVPGAPDCTHIASTVTCDLGNLPPGGNQQVKIGLTTPAVAGPINNQVSVLADENDPNPGNNLITTMVQIV